MVKKVSAVFDKTIVVLNVGAVIDMKWIKKYNISSVLYVWQGGMCGGSACADLLLGKTSPSGKLADTIAYDISDYSSTSNFGGKEFNLYKEDIYVGYRYFETFNKAAVLYPFGYGMSYTDFEITATCVAENDKITINATVTNIGEYAGKEVVQAYFGAPCGKLGKSAKELIAYAKTKELKPKESQTLVLEINVDDMRAYDDSGATGNKSCYVLEAGQYIIYLGNSVSDATAIYVHIENETRVVEKCTEALSPSVEFERIKAGANGTLEYEKTPVRTYSVKDRVNKNLPKEIPYTGDKGIKLEDVRTGKNTIEDFVAQLSDTDLCCLVRGEGMNSPKVTPGTGSCFGGMTEELIGFGIPIVCTTDGPSGIRMDSGLLATSMPNGTCLACSFNDELVSDLYALEGVEMTAYEIDVILGPGINIHRSPLNGRNFEYFSEDPYLTGKMATAISKGLAKAGVWCTIKHYMANSQEWYRHTNDSIMSERAAREIYARPFEMAVKNGGVKAIMTAYNSVNGYHAASNYDMTKTLLRDEWGYDGFVMTDWWAHITSLDGVNSTNDFASMVKAQNDIYMVMENAKTHEDNLEESLKNGYLTRGELQVCAINLCKFVMYTHAYERFRANGFKYDISDLDTSNMTVVKEITAEIGNSEKHSFEKSGKYIVEIEFTSPLTSLAQIAINLSIDKRGDCTFISKGTDGGVGIMKAHVSVMSGEHDLCFTSKADVTIKSVKFLI